MEDGVNFLMTMALAVSVVVAGLVWAFNKGRHPS